MSTAPREDRSFRNVVQLAIEFFFIFFAFLSCGYVEETVINNFAAAGANISKHDGYMRYFGLRMCVWGRRFHETNLIFLEIPLHMRILNSNKVRTFSEWKWAIL